MNREQAEVVIIGAGPSGALAAALLQQEGVDVLVLEKQRFPRFSIGESLLPQLMVFLEKAGMTDVIAAAGFQRKNGATFQKRDMHSEFNFEEKHSEGPYNTYQVKRAEFDKLLADHVEQQGVPVYYEHEVVSLENQDNSCRLTVSDANTEQYQLEAGFVLDASGFGRVLPRLLELETPSDFPVRKSVFCHIKDNISDAEFDRNKILISVHPSDEQVWYWLIPFSDGTSSFGVVGPPDFFSKIGGGVEHQLVTSKLAEPGLAKLLSAAEIVTEVRDVSGFSANVKALYGNNYALLGNAGEFLDPVFSSGVTIALKSADLATSVLLRQRRGEQVCWQSDYSEALMLGVDTFRAFVNAWYDGRLQDIIFHQGSVKEIKEKICSILAGFAWDETNPYVQKPERRINVLAAVCRENSP